ncbi:glycosyltransferase [Synechococcus sp. BA-120 BA3]|nr:glycosyltransferase [Synechococcus sp. BA-120 BA3]
MHGMEDTPQLFSAKAMADGQAEPASSIAPKSGRSHRVILIVAMGPLDRSLGGGIVFCEHLRSLAATEHTETHVFAQDARRQGEGRDFSTSVGAVFHPLDLQPPGEVFPGMPTISRHPFSLERQAAENWLVDQRFREIAEDIRPDVIVIEYLFTALFMPSAFHCGVPIVTITSNREQEFYSDQRRLGRLPAMASDSLLAEWRLGRFESEVLSKSDYIVVLSSPDIPRNRLQASRTSVIEPILQEHARKWRHGGGASIFFVGDISHYPNYSAVQWLCQSLAPALASCAPWVRLAIIGADSADVPQAWLQPNVDLLGRSTADEVLRRFTSCGLFIAPIENSFGSKIKILQALAHATPLLATAESLSGVPGADGIPLFTLDDPQGAAELAASLLDSPQELVALSRLMDEIRTRNLTRTRSAWPSLIEQAASAKALPRRFRSWSFLLPRGTPTVRGRVVEVGASSYYWIHSEGLGLLEGLNGRPLRWTADTATLSLRIDPAKPPLWLRVLTWDIAPEGGSRLDVFANDIHILGGSVVGGSPWDRVVRLPPLGGCRTLTLRFSAPGFQIAGDDRVLGVALESVRVGRSTFRMKAYPWVFRYLNTHRPLQRLFRRFGVVPM